LFLVKASKIIALGIVSLPLTGCAIATGIVFASLINSISRSPDLEDSLFNSAMLGFAFVESFSFFLIIFIVIIFII
jgi:F0F1-type ATP synthase membrane subunit c/vacuolar-type H+-ATPase subunit K